MKYSKELHEQLRKRYKDSDPAYVQCLLDEIERLQNERRWIPVSEELPECNCNVLALLDDCTVIMCNYTTNGAGAFFDPDVRAVSDNFIEYPTHWMYLPEPPEEK